MLTFIVNLSVGQLQLLLSGYSDIPNDGSAVIAIPDMGTHDQGMALICRHGLTGIPPSAAVDKWLFVHENGDEEEIGSSGDIGFSVSRDQSEGDVRLERIAGATPLEGTYKCSVETSSSTVTVELYWPCKLLASTSEKLSFQFCYDS